MFVSLCAAVFGQHLGFWKEQVLGDTEVMGVVGSGFQAAGVAPARKPVLGGAGLLLCTASLN